MAVLPVHLHPVHPLPKGKEVLAAVAQAGVSRHSGRRRAKAIHAFAVDYMGRTL